MVELELRLSAVDDDEWLKSCIERLDDDAVLTLLEVELAVTVALLEAGVMVAESMSLPLPVAEV